MMTVLGGSIVSLALIGATVICAGFMVDRSINMLLLFVVGGFLVRLLAVLGVGVFVYFMTDLNLVTFYLGLFGSYVVLQILEIVYLQKRLIKQKK